MFRCGNKMKKQHAWKKRIRQIFSSAVGILTLLAVFSAAFFLIIEAGHVRHCHHEDDCPVCACMQMCEEQLHRLGGPLTAGIVCLFVFAFAACIFNSVRVLIIEATPVSRKVRLNN